MITETPQTPESSAALFAARLQATREALQFDRKDVAAQLRLNEKVIKMMETNDYPADLPPTFIRGYLRTYAKLLNIPESETLQHIETIQPKQVATLTPAIESMKGAVSSQQQNYFMHIFTSVIVLTLFALVGTWWHTHSATPSSTMMAANNVSSPIVPITNDNMTESQAPQQTVTTEPQATAPTPEAAHPPSMTAHASDAPTSTAAPAPSNTKATPNQNDMDSDDEDETDSDTDNDAAD